MGKLLDDKEFKLLKNNLIKVSQIDGKDKFRVRMIEYINDTADNNDDMFFYEMLPFSRFINPGSEDIAYTTPEHLIYLNAPGIVGENVRIWDFIYCHECLHQLWDTFGVADKIKQAGVEYNHNVLNIASDCVINDYLKRIRKKEPFSDGIFKEVLQEKFGVDYDPKNDTQYSLYLKLIKVYKDNKKEMDKMGKDCENQNSGSNGNSQSGSSGSSSSSSNGSDNNSQSGSGGSSSSSSNGSDNNSQSDSSGYGEKSDANSAQDAVDKAKKQLQEVEKNTTSKDGKISQDSLNKAKDAIKKAQKAADKAKECADKGDKEGESKAAKEAEEAAKEAIRKLGGNAEDLGDTEELTQEEINEIRKNAENIIKKYKDKLSGALGEFLNKCKSSASLKKEGLTVNTIKGHSGWNTSMNNICKAFVKKKVFQKKRQTEKTYSRVKRGSGFVKFGQPIEPGRRIKEDKLNINVAFYIDKSGSMMGSIDNVFNAVFYISDSLKKTFGKEKIVDETVFENYAFDTSLYKLKFNEKAKASGGTMSFNDLLDHINKNTKDFLINVIITDAEFSTITVSTIKNLLNSIDGILLFITNNDNSTIQNIAKENRNKMHYILANSDFGLD